MTEYFVKIYVFEAFFQQLIVLCNGSSLMTSHVIS